MNFLRESIYYSPSAEGSLYGSLEPDKSSGLVSDYVHNLANGIYKEFESLIYYHGENDVKTLMPMVVSCLETLDRVYSEKHNLEVEFELLKEDSRQLMTQYEREKSQRKSAEENLFKSEDNYIEISKGYEEEIQKLKSILKMHEIRLKNLQEQAIRIEKRDVEKQLEYDKLLSRHHELIRYHRDYLEKSRNLQIDRTLTEKSNNQKIKSIHSIEIKPCNDFELSDSDDLKQTAKFNYERNLSEELDIFEKSKEIKQIYLENDLIYGKAQIFSQCDWDITSTKSDDETCVSYNEEICTSGTMPLDYELAGMSHEIESIIRENNDLIATKNALNIVKDDLILKLDEANSEIEILQHENNSLNTMKSSLKLRIKDLEIENKGLKQEVSILHSKTSDDKDEENIPISQRKRFTRLEMARVLMERNQYKEKLLEMEEYVKWIKMLKNKKEKKLTIWERFSRLFKSDNHNSIVRREIQNDNNSNPAPQNINIIRNPVLRSHSISNCSALKDSNRQQLNGWSLPPNVSVTVKANLPIPIYCRPLLENQFGLKITCGVAVNMSGGFNKNGDRNVGSSIFYDSQFSNESKINYDFMEIEEKINQRHYINEFGTSNKENSESSKFNESEMWVCTCSDNQSQIIVIDVNKPANYLDAFIIPTSPVQCLCSVPGANAKDYFKNSVDIWMDNQLSKQMDVKLNQSKEPLPNFTLKEVDCILYKPRHITLECEKSVNIDDFTLSRNYKLPSDPVSNKFEELNSEKPSQIELFEHSSMEPTIWIGCRNGDLFVHSASGNRSHCLHHVKLPDSITNIIYQNSKVFVSLANGSLIIFYRYLSNENTNLIGQWQMSKYYLLEPENYNNSIRCLEPILLTNKIWIGYKNQVIVVDDTSITLDISFDAHPRSDYTVRQMCCAGDGVWISLRLDTTLRLFHTYHYQHLQDLNVEPYINKLIEPSHLGLSLLRITCLSTSCHRLWIGTNKGIIISAPFISDVKKETEISQVEIINDFLNNATNNDAEMLKNNSCSPTFIPYILPEDLQLSYHGHRDAVKFFITVPYGNQNFKEKQTLEVENSNHVKSDFSSSKSKFLIISGGEGYKDFRLNENALTMNSKPSTKSENLIKNNSHLIVWMLSKKTT